MGLSEGEQVGYESITQDESDKAHGGKMINCPRMLRCEPFPLEVRSVTEMGGYWNIVELSGKCKQLCSTRCSELEATCELSDASGNTRDGESVYFDITKE